MVGPDRSPREFELGKRPMNSNVKNGSPDLSATIDPRRYPKYAPLLKTLAGWTRVKGAQKSPQKAARHLAGECD